MNRPRMLLLTALVGLLAAALPLAMMTWLSWHHAANTAQAQLRETAERALERADHSYLQALSALQAMQHTPLAPCSPEHIQLMQTRVVTTSSVDQISYFQQGRVRCTSWGRPVAGFAPGQPDHTTADGATLQLDQEPRAPYGRCMLSLRLGDYEALMDPFHFVDLIGTRDIRIAVATPDGRLIAQQSLPDQALLQSLLRDPRTRDDGTLLFASARREAGLAIETTPRTGMAGIFLQQAWVLVPISLLLGAAAIACTIALSRRRYSLKGELSHAIRRNELYVVYQPIIELETGICVGAEALVRWRRAHGREVQPDLFIPLGQASRLVGAVSVFRLGR